MDIQHLVEKARKKGVSITETNGTLEIESSEENEHLLQEIKENKKAIVEHLNGTKKTPNATNRNTTAERIESVALPKPRKFPSHLFPEPCRSYITEAADAIGCDESQIALPLLAVIGTAIGNKRTIRLKKGWEESPVIWGALIGLSGSHKSPALDAVLSLFSKQEAIAAFEHEKAIEKYEEAIKYYEREMSDWKRQKKQSQLPIKPEAPEEKSYLVSDTTMEAMTSILASQFDGILMARDELTGWFSSFGEYKGGKGGDLAHWLTYWSSKSLKVNRKTGDQKQIRVKRASVGIIGGIQPDILKKTIGSEYINNGLCARFLFTMPTQKKVEWSEKTIEPTIERTTALLIDELLTITPSADGDGREMPYPMTMTPKAMRLWVRCFNKRRSNLLNYDQGMRAAATKLEAYTARFALIFQLIACPQDEIVDEVSMKAAIKLSAWFEYEAHRVYWLFTQSKEERENHELAEWINARGGSVSPREMMRGPKKYRSSASTAEKALIRLVTAGYGTWEIGESATKQSRFFKMKEPTCDRFKRNGEK